MKKFNKKQIIVDLLPRILWVVEGLCLYLGIRYYNFAFNGNIPFDIVAWIAICVGAMFILWIILYVGKDMITRDLKTGGPYRLIRHPMYSAMYLILIGIGLLISSYTWFIVLIIFIPLWYLAVKIEERQLISLHGEKYLEYKKKTSMFF